MKKKEILLGEILKEGGYVGEKEIEDGLALQKEKGGYLGECLRELGYVTEEQVLWALAEQYNLSFVPINLETIDAELVLKIPKEFALQNLVLPLYQIGDSIAFAIGAPQAVEKVEKLKTFLKGFSNMDFEYSLSSPREIREVLEIIFDRYKKEDNVEEPKESEKVLSALGRESTKVIGDSKPSWKVPILFQEILEKGIQEGVVAIHFLFPSSYNMEGKILLETFEKTWAEASSISKDWMEGLIHKALSLSNPFSFSFKDKEYLFQIEVLEGRRISLHQIFPFPALPSPLADLLPDLPPKGILIFLGHPKEKYRLIFQWIQHYKKFFSCMVGLTEPFYPYPSEIYWENGLYPPFPSDLIYTSRGKEYYLKELITQCPTILLNQDYLNFSRYFLKKWEKLLDLPVSGALEAYSFPKLCSHCSRVMGETDLIPLPFVLKEYESPGCEECSFLGYKGRVQFWAYWNWEKISLLYEVPLDERKRSLLTDSQLIPKLVKANHEGRLSSQICQAFFE